MKKTLLVITSLLFFGAIVSSVIAQAPPSELPDAISELLFADVCKNGCAKEEVARWRSNLKFEQEDLNDDGVPEFFVWIDHSDWCGAGANCDYWIFQKQAHGYVL